MGVITYLLLVGRLPFDSRKKEAVIAKTVAGVLDFSDDDVRSVASIHVRDFICQCLQVPKRPLESTMRFEVALSCFQVNPIQAISSQSF